MSTPSESFRFVPAPHPRIRPVPAFRDNYLWLIIDATGTRAAVVDPGDANAIERALAAASLSLDAILLTHHHADHTGGVAALAAHWGCPVHGPRADPIDGIDHPLDDGDRLELPALGIDFEVIAVPGHTLGHIAYFGSRLGEEDPRGVLFCGDTLFAAGCGRLFEGTPAQMHRSLGRLAALPPDTLVYCAHEYTLSNLAFASAAEPGSGALAARIAEARTLRERDIPTVPSAIGIERETNPFLRTTSPAVIERLAERGIPAGADTVERFAALRAWKDEF
ncbi:MAG: hydroxyacylglutathione hydrolase [Pseudomonadota bacterium]|jgi:hydroxyacylglutathione hydrolase|nr:hydroxyacylglutathione hydrolase [Pseudomonadota bacterium]